MSVIAILLAAMEVPARAEAVWTVKADPAAKTATVDVKIHMKISVTFPQTVKFPPPQLPSSRIPFAIVDATGHRQWRILDLHTGKVQSAADTGDLTGEVVSPDLKYVAGWGSDSGYACQIWSLEKNQRLVSMKGTASQPPKPIGFRSPQDLLLSCLIGLDDLTLTETDPQTGKSERTYTLPLAIRPEDHVFSPGGRYLAMISTRRGRQSLAICELETGKLVGLSPIPADRFGFANAGSVLSMAFSLDGSDLAVLFGQGGENRLICWSASTGKVHHDLNPFKPDLGMGVPEGGALTEFLPDGKTLRVHHSLYDLTTGNLLDSIPAEAGINNPVAIMQMLSDNRALVAIEPSMQSPAMSLETQLIDR